MADVNDNTSSDCTRETCIQAQIPPDLTSRLNEIRMQANEIQLLKEEERKLDDEMALIKERQKVLASQTEENCSMLSKAAKDVLNVTVVQLEEIEPAVDALVTTGQLHEYIEKKGRLESTLQKLKTKLENTERELGFVNIELGKVNVCEGLKRTRDE